MYFCAQVLSKAELQFLALLPTLRPKVRVIAECGNWYFQMSFSFPAFSSSQETLNPVSSCPHLYSRDHTYNNVGKPMYLQEEICMETTRRNFRINC